MYFGKILYGGDYNPEQWLAYPEILKKDIEYMKVAQINLVSIGIFSWAMLEPKKELRFLMVGGADRDFVSKRNFCILGNPIRRKAQMDGGEISGNLPGRRKPRKRAVRRKA